MEVFTVRGTNWMIDIELDRRDFIEAGTLAVETILQEGGCLFTFDRISEPKIGSIIQVAVKGHIVDTEIEDLDLYEEAMGELDMDYVQLLYSPMVIANAGHYTLAEFKEREIIRSLEGRG